MLFAYGSGLIARSNGLAAQAAAKRASAEPTTRPSTTRTTTTSGMLALGAIAHWWLSARAFLRRTIAALPRRRPARFEIDDGSRAAGGARAERVEPPTAKRRVSADGRARVEPEFFAADRMPTTGFDDDGYDDSTIMPTRCSATAAGARRRQVQNFRSPAGARVASPGAAPGCPARACSARRRPR